MRRLVARLLFWPTLAWNVLWGRVFALRPWWSRVDDRVILGALPFASDVARLREEGVTAVVNICGEHPGPVRAYEEAGIVQLRLLTPDFSAPSLEDMQRGVAFIQRHVGEGRTVYVHCKAGRGRSATLVLCWLVACKGVSPEEAYAMLVRKRAHVVRRFALRPVIWEFWVREGVGGGGAGQGGGAEGGD